MQTMHPTLLIGPGDWDPRQIPRSEYDERLAALWREHADANGAIVYGDSRDHAALFYLTHFTPKLEAAIALIPRRGEAQMLIGGGPNMLPAAKPLTFISALAPLRDAAKTTVEWARGLGGGGLVILGGDAMPQRLRRALDQALGDGVRVANGDVGLQARKRRKSEDEVRMVREACVTLDAAVAALRDAARSRKSVTDCILTAEHAALRRGAQDVRSLFSLDGGRTLRPFDIPIATKCDPLQAYIAVRRGGYWAEAFVQIATQIDALKAKTESVLRDMIAAAKPGTSAQQLRTIIETGRGALRVHPLADRSCGSSIGLSLDEAPLLTADSNVTLEQDGIYSLRAGFVDESGAGAIASAMVHITAGGPHVLWPMNSAA
jgi:Xaa-Pro aminopeptidase